MKVILRSDPTTDRRRGWQAMYILSLVSYLRQAWTCNVALYWRNYVLPISIRKSQAKNTSVSNNLASKSSPGCSAVPGLVCHMMCQISETKNGCSAVLRSVPDPRGSALNYREAGKNCGLLHSSGRVCIKHHTTASLCVLKFIFMTEQSSRICIVI